MNSDRLRELTRIYAIRSAVIYFAIIFAVSLYLINEGMFFTSIDAIVNFLGIPATDPMPFEFLRSIFFALAFVQSGGVLVAIFMFFVCHIHYMIEQKIKEKAETR